MNEKIAFEKMPKINLHHHMEGAMRPKTFLELGKKNGFFSSATTVEEIIPRIQIKGQEKSLAEYLKKVDITAEVMREGKDFIRLTSEIVEDSYENGVQYLELRGGPTLHVREKLHLEDVLEGILEGLQQGEKHTGVKTNFIVTALRHEDSIKNINLVKVAAKYRKYGVVGFDLAGDEIGYPAKAHQAVFDKAREEGFGITVHAGEVVGHENVKEAIELLGASRIGHGIASIHSPSLLDYLKEKEILLEVCPTSNVHTTAVEGYEKHPIRNLFDKGIWLCVNDDDPTTSNINLTQEVLLLYSQFGFSLEELKKLQYNAIEKAFLTKEEKRKLRSEFDVKYRCFFQDA